jgi:HD-like signal output (HDOD) protein
VNVFSQFDGNAHVAVHLPSIWDHSIAASKLAQRIATSENCSKAVIEECFTAGLLHDLGRVILMAELPREALQLYTTDSGASLKAERERLGCTHAEVGAYLMSIWGLPLPLVHAVAYHHHPNEAGDAQFSAPTAVHFADAIVSENDPSPLNHDATVDAPYLSCLGLTDKECKWRELHKDAASKTSAASA